MITLDPDKSEDKEGKKVRDYFDFISSLKTIAIKVIYCTKYWKQRPCLTQILYLHRYRIWNFFL